MSIATPQGPAGERPKLLLVDDRPENLFALRTAMRSLDSEIHTSESGNEALAMMLSHRYAVVVLDVQMPGMDGFETASLMHSNPATRDVPVIFVTAISKEEQYQRRGYEVGAVDYLLKPIDPGILLSKVQVFLRMHEQKLAINCALRELKQLSHRNELILSCAEEGILGIDRSGHIVFANEAAERDLCCTGRSSLVGEHIRILMTEPGRAQEMLGQIVGRYSHRRGVECQFERSDGSVFPVALSIGAVGDDTPADSDVAGVLVFRDMSDRKDAEEKLMRLASYDALTGLANRTLFHDALGAGIARAQRSGTVLGVLIVNLDDFKLINDERGHDVGDAVLRAVAHAITEGVRRGDLVARLGGDEFAVILEDMECADNARQVGEKILSRLACGLDLAPGLVTISGSVGASILDATSDTPEDLLKMADIAMYDAKRNGRNQVAVFSPDMAVGARRQLHVARELVKALEEETLSVAYQPQYEGGSRRMVGMEALARWAHPELGLVPPDEFIPLAEKGRQIERLGEFVLRHALAEFQALCARGLVDQGARLAVNVSALQLTCLDFPDRVASLLDESGLPAHCLELELTESAMMTDPDTSEKCLKNLNALGVGIAVDDFGTGYASLSYLQRLPVDTLKIDRSFVSKIGRSRNDDALVSAILGLGRELGLRVVAEGVETEAQAEFLEASRCDVLQGYLFARPQAAEDIVQLLMGEDDSAMDAIPEIRISA